MLPAKNNCVINDRWRRFPLTGIFILLLVPVALLFFSSCNKSEGQDEPYSNKNFTKVLDSANHLYDGGKLTRAAHYFDSVMNTGQFTALPQKFDYYNFNCNYYFHALRDNSKAMLYADSMLNLFDTQQKKIKYITDYGLAFYYKGDVLFAENKYNEAYRYLYQGKLIANKGLNKCSLGDFSYRMAMILYKQEHYRLAAANFKNSTRETEACGLGFRYFYRRQELLSNTGLSYTEINEADSALMYYKLTLDFIEKEGKPFMERPQMLDMAKGVVYGNMARVYIRQNKFQQAKKLLKKSISINLRKGNDNEDAEQCEIKLANLYYQTNETDSLIRLLNVVHKQLDSTKNDDAQAEWNLLMSNYYRKKKQPEIALQYYVKYDALKDSIVNKNKALKEADIAQQIKRLEKDSEFDTLKKDNIQQDFYLKTGAVFGAMLLLIFFLILRNWRKSRRNIKVLGDLNHKINDQNYSLEHALNELKLSSQEKDRILRTVAHDLRNPIGGIASLTLAMADDDYTDEQKELINLIRETSNNSIELINEILEVTNNGATSLNKEMVEINSLLSHSVELLRFKAAEKDQKIILELLDAPLDLLISREKIWRVISNLISNAIKFSPIGGTILVKIADTGKDAEISVTDNGIGIPPDMKQKVFNMFTEAKRPGTLGEKSFGLGLSISKQIIENHGGTIGFESVVGNGTSFHIKLPKEVIGALSH